MTTTPTTPGQLAETLSFFASVIKSGEPWTDICQQHFDKAKAYLAALPAERAETRCAACDTRMKVGDAICYYCHRARVVGSPAERAQEWEQGGTLGNDERYIRRSSPESEASIQQALGLPVDTGHEGGEVCAECGRYFGKHFPKCSKAKRAQAGEPVGYIHPISAEMLNRWTDAEAMYSVDLTVWRTSDNEFTVPLYTHPAPATAASAESVIVPRKLAEEVQGYLGYLVRKSNHPTVRNAAEKLGLILDAPPPESADKVTDARCYNCKFAHEQSYSTGTQLKRWCHLGPQRVEVDAGYSCASFAAIGGQRDE